MYLFNCIQIYFVVLPHFPEIFGSETLFPKDCTIYVVFEILGSSASHHNKRRVICQSNKSHFESHRKAFYEAYSRARQVIGWFLSDSEKFGRMNAISTYLRLESREVSFLTKLFSPRDTLAHFLMLRSWSYLSIYFSTNFLICCVTLLTDLGGALKRLHLTLTYYIFYFCFLRSIVLIVHNPCRLLAISWGKWVFCGFVFFCFFEKTVELAMD